ncbi:MAG TPA: hypothetical protein VN873_03350 [Candidatus Angelobacter sp.]|nr:hypothetical protein [Candidatus Angelobacter sp.]
MKHLVIAMAFLAAFSASAQIGVDAIAKQRARDVANQNNRRSMNPMPAAPAQAAPAAPQLTPGQRAFAVFQAQLFQVNSNSTPDLKQKLAQDMGSVAQGANKPSQATLSKLSEHLTTAWDEAKLTTAGKTRVAREVGVLLNSANTPPAQKQAMIDDVKSNLKTVGASDDAADAVAADLQSVAEEVKTAAK